MKTWEELKVGEWGYISEQDFGFAKIAQLELFRASEECFLFRDMVSVSRRDLEMYLLDEFTIMGKAEIVKSGNGWIWEKE